MDYNEDFCTITVESPLLGFAYWTNTTDEKSLLKIKKAQRLAVESENAWIKYLDGDFVIQFQNDKAREINGQHKIKVTLIDERANLKEYLIFFNVETDPQEFVPTYWSPPPADNDDIVVSAEIYSINQNA